MHAARVLLVIVATTAVEAGCVHRQADPLCPYDAALRPTIAAEFSSDTGAIRGRVVAITGEPLGGSRVQLSPGNRTIETRRDGTFRFDRLSAGEYTLVVSRVGYGTARDRLRLLPNGGVQVATTLGASVICLTSAAPFVQLEGEV